MASAEYHRQWRTKRKNDTAWLEHRRKVYRNYVERKKRENLGWWEKRKKAKRESFRKHRVLKPKKPKLTIEEKNAKRHQRYFQLKKQVLEAYGNKCVCCKEERIECLSIDHIDNGRLEGTKKHGINLYSWLKRNGFPEGYRVLCLNCNSALGFYGYCPHQGQPEIVLNRNVKYYRKLKKTVIKAYGGKCMKCGEGHWEFLQIDHINGGGNEHRRSILKSFYVWLKQNDYPKGFQVLCANCNWNKYAIKT